MRMFEENRSNPFQFRHITLCHSLEELAKVPEPKVSIHYPPPVCVCDITYIIAYTKLVLIPSATYILIPNHLFLY